MKKSKEISRRELLGAGLAAAAGTLISPDTSLGARLSGPQSGPTNGGSPRALVLMCDRYHNQDYIRVSLDQLFKELGLPVDYTTNYYDLSARLLQPYQLFIALRDERIWPGGYSSGFAEEGARQPQDGLENPGEFPPEQAESWITEEQGQAVKDFVSAGQGFYSLHNNALVSRSSKNYRDVQGGVALGHPPVRPFKVRIANTQHPITQGVEDFMVTDEQYYAIYDKDPKNILLHGENLDGFTFETGSRPAAGRGRGAAAPENQDLSAAEAPQDHGTTSIGGWAHEFGKGRVVFTALGHTNEVMWHPEYFKIQKNAVRWLLKEL
jgi:type 1 glutamine amidotransferase